jgi:GDP-L-fucose synthase
MPPPTLFPLSGRRVFVAGHRGMVGSALIRRLAQEECRMLTVGRDAVDLRDQAAVDRWFDEHRPDAVLLPQAPHGLRCRASWRHPRQRHPSRRFPVR